MRPEQAAVAIQNALLKSLSTAGITYASCIHYTTTRSGKQYTAVCFVSVSSLRDYETALLDEIATRVGVSALRITLRVSNYAYYPRFPTGIYRVEYTVHIQRKRKLGPSSKCGYVLLCSLLFAFFYVAGILSASLYLYVTSAYT